MEETNNTVSSNIPNQFNQIPKPNIYKYLFFISLVILFGVIFYFYVANNNRTSQLLNNNISEIIPTSIPTNFPTVTPSNEVTKTTTPTTNTIIKPQYKATSIQDDKNSITKLVLIDQDNNETVIDESKYWKMAENIMKPSYSDFMFSPDNNFLYYYRNSGWEGGSSYLYNILNKKVIELGIYADTKGFSPDSKYFYACAEGGMMSGGAIIKEVDTLNNIFIANDEGDSYKCQYNKSTGEVVFSEFDPFSYEGQTVLSQYKFSEKTGSLMKIK